MAFGWFKKNKNKSAPEVVEEQEAPRQIDEEPVPDQKRRKWRLRRYLNRKII